MSNQVLLSFGEAVKFLEKGKRVARLGWNGKGMYLVHFSPVGHGLEMLTVYDKEEGTTLPLLPFILMKTADNCYVPWLASQTDILEKDYIIVETGYISTPKEDIIKYDGPAPDSESIVKEKVEDFNIKITSNETSALSEALKNWVDDQFLTTKMTYDQAKLYRLGQLKTDYICVKSLYPKNNNECKCSSCQQESKSSLEKIADEIHNDLQSQTETKKSESKQDDCLDCATSFLGICDKHFTQKLKEIDKQTEKQYMENMKNAEDPIAFFNSLITLVELNKKNKVNHELVEELLDETFIGKKSINEQEDVSTGSLFDIAYCVLENVVLHELDKDINKPFWDFIREAKKQGYKRVVLTNGKQYEINDDGSVTTLN